MRFNNRNMDYLREQYPAGTRLELVSMEGERDMPPGLRGTVQFVDDAGQIHLKWDNAHGLALVPGTDSFRTLTPEEIAIEQGEQAQKAAFADEDEENVSIGDIHISPDFQCDQTGGYPTSLVWNMENGTTILQPSPAFDDDSEEAKQCLCDCADWGVHPCVSWDDFNGLLELIGKDAVRNAYVSDDDEFEEFGGMSFQ